MVKCCFRREVKDYVEGRRSKGRLWNYFPRNCKYKARCKTSNHNDYNNVSILTILIKTYDTKLKILILTKTVSVTTP